MNRVRLVLNVLVALSFVACADDDMRSTTSEKVVSWDGVEVLVALELDAPRVGKNPFAVKVTRHGDGQPVTDLVVSVVPDMPSMGHGSSGNIDPTHVGDGRYEGSVNLTMPGEWRIVFDFVRDGDSVGTIDYDISI